MTLPRSWWVPVAGALLAPLGTWLPMLAHEYPGLGLPVYAPPIGIALWQSQVFWAVAFAAVGAALWVRDRWLGVLLWLLAGNLLIRGSLFARSHFALVLVGVLALVALRQTPRVWHGRLRLILAVSGMVQVAYMLQQAVLHYDLLWGPVVGGVLVAKVQPLGTLGTVDAASAYVAITAPLMPLWALPFGVGLLARWLMQEDRPRVRAVGLAAALLTLGGAVIAVGLWKHAVSPTIPGWGTVTGRLTIWAFALSDWWTQGLFHGFGLSSWSLRIPMLQQQAGGLPNGERGAQAHSEPLQAAYETGVLGVAVLGAWLRDHWRAWQSPAWGPALGALAVSTLGFFTFHVVSTALLGLVLFGLASAQTAEAHGGERQCPCSAEFSPGHHRRSRKSCRPPARPAPAPRGQR